MNEPFKQIVGFLLLMVVVSRSRLWRQFIVEGGSDPIQERLAYGL